MNSIKLTYINYVQMIKFMSSDFFVWCFIVVCFEEIWTRPYSDVLTNQVLQEMVNLDLAGDIH